MQGTCSVFLLAKPVLGATMAGITNVCIVYLYSASIINALSLPHRLSHMG